MRNISGLFGRSPFEPLVDEKNPAGVRIGVQEMTRFGMGTGEMDTIASFMKKCLLDGKYVGDEITEFRGGFQKICYSYDDVQAEETKE